MFTSGITIVRVRGIPIRLHVSLLFFLPYVVFIATRQFAYIANLLGAPVESLRLPPIAWGAILAASLFVSILLHELAHCAVALGSGGRVHSITLMMLGGVTRISHPGRPEKEAWMAFAGPLTSFGLGALAYGVYRLVPMPPGAASALVVIAVMNVGLAVFNLLPAFPLDGGRVLRGLLARRMEHDRATRIATSVGRVMAVALGILAIASFNVLLGLIALFVFMGASSERSRVETRELLKDIPIEQLMTARLGEAYASESTADVARRMLHDGDAGARVIDRRGAVEPPSPSPASATIGVVTAADLAQSALRKADGTVAEAMRSDQPTVHLGDGADRMLEALGSSEAATVVVLDQRDQIVGLVTPAEIERVLLLNGVATRKRAA